MNTIDEIRFKATNKSTFAKAYDIPPRTFQLWLKPIENELGEYIGKCFNPKQVATIVRLLGKPEKFELIIMQ